MPSVSTVGAVAAEFETLNKVTRVLLRSSERPSPDAERLILLDDAFRVADESIREMAEGTLAKIAERTGISLERITFAEISGIDMDLSECNEKALRNLQTLEFENTVGDWIENHHPKLGKTFSLAYGNVKSFDRKNTLASIYLCDRIFEGINQFLRPGTVICFPTTPTIAPLKGSLNTMEAVLNFYDRTMAITSFSGVGRLPEISTPLLAVDGCPAGLSFAAAHYEDEFLLESVRTLLGEDL